MKNFKLLVLLGLAVAVSSPVLADGGQVVSYGLKKQGRVAFEGKQEDVQAVEQENVTDATPAEISPADVEPAAGEYEVDDKVDVSTLADRIRLPRK